MAGWVYFAASIWGALFTVNALRPLQRPAALVPWSFFPAWLTTELALHHILWQAAASGVFVYYGALDGWPGRAGAVLTLASWLGLGQLSSSAHRDGPVVSAALKEALGEDYADAVDPRWAQHLRHDVDWARVLWPFRIGDRSVQRIVDIPYGDPDEPRHRLDVYRRRDVAPGAPVLLQIHGGGWMIGSKDTQGLPLVFHLAKRGWVCVSINYRLSPKVTWPGHLVDCKRALHWVREHIADYGGDPSLVIASGSSAGGHLATMLALTAGTASLQPGFEHADTSVQGLVAFYGVFDWTDRYGYRGPADRMRKRLERHIVKLPHAEHHDVYHRASPMSHVGPHVPPAMILHGKNDTVAPAAEAAHFVELLREHSEEPVVHVEFAHAHHAFEMFPSVRALHAIHGVEAFAAWIATHRSNEPVPAARRKTANLAP